MLREVTDAPYRETEAGQTPRSAVTQQGSLPDGLADAPRSSVGDTPPAAEAEQARESGAPPTERSARRSRTALSHRVRFEVFKRDRFTCQYCGRQAPDVVLEVDHIEPVVLGGAERLLNYVTACADCNRGKGPRRLSDDSALRRQRRQMDELAARREQMEMLYAWQRELGALEAETVEKLAAYWRELAPGWRHGEDHPKVLRKLAREFPVDLVMLAMRVAAGRYVVLDDAGKATRESAALAWGKVTGICQVKALAAERPYLEDLYYIRGILRRRFPDKIVGWQALDLLERGYELGWRVEWMRDWAKRAASWGGWRNLMQDQIAEDEAALKAEKVVERSSRSAMVREPPVPGQPQPSNRGPGTPTPG